MLFDVIPTTVLYKVVMQPSNGVKIRAAPRALGGFRGGHVVDGIIAVAMDGAAVVVPSRGILSQVPAFVADQKCLPASVDEGCRWLEMVLVANIGDSRSSRFDSQLFQAPEL